MVIKGGVGWGSYEGGRGGGVVMNAGLKRKLEGGTIREDIDAWVLHFRGL